MEIMSGLGQKDRKRLSAIFRETKGTISVCDVARILNITSNDAAKMLARWAKKSWLSRIHRGLYVRVPFESYTSDIALEDPWIIAVRLFSPCYIGGWTAAEHWDLTEQIFRTIVVLTTHKPRNRALNIKGTNFMLRTIPEKALFGTKPIWRGQVKVSISDPSRTILDMLADPKLGGGIRPTVDMLMNYMKSENKNVDLLIEYAKRLGNGAVFKRLGFLLERYSPDQKTAIDVCAAHITKGIAKLDPGLKATKIISRWRIWVPDQWARET
jgi:predicted transcriptional regulator of viral defense system